jgi:hypothetical protein
MVYSTARGLEYCILLNKKYDYFDIIPDLEKLTRRRLELKNGNILKVIPMKDTDERLLKSLYYQVKKNNWLDCSHKCLLCFPSIEFTQEEETALNKIKEYFNNDYVIRGWYDTAIYY